MYFKLRLQVRHVQVILRKILVAVGHATSRRPVRLASRESDDDSSYPDVRNDRTIRSFWSLCCAGLHSLAFGNMSKTQRWPGKDRSISKFHLLIILCNVYYLFDNHARLRAASQTMPG